MIIILYNGDSLLAREVDSKTELSKSKVLTNGVRYTISSGGKGGKYYTISSNICHILDLKGLACNTLTSIDSKENIRNVVYQKSNIALVQEDVLQRFAQYILSSYKKNKNNDKSLELRKLISLYPATYNLVVQEGTYDSVNSLKGKKVDILGYKPSKLLGRLLWLTGSTWVNDDLQHFQAVKNLEDSFINLCDGKIDAIFMLSGHASYSISEATKHCNIKFISASDNLMNSYIAYYPYFHKVYIPTYLYNHQEAIKSIGIYNSLITTNKISDKDVYLFLDTFFENLESLNQDIPNIKENIINNIKVQNLQNIPYHKAALAYFKEHGWVK